MKNKRFNKVLSGLLALVLCVGMVPATVIPTAAFAAELGSNEWVVRNDDFSSYPVGEDTFWKNERYLGFGSSSHGVYGSDSYSTYGIVEENGNKVLRLVSMNTTPNNFYLPKVSGAYSLSFDYAMEKSQSSVPGLALQMFNNVSPSLPKSVTVYIEPYGVRLVEYISTGEKSETYVQTAAGKNMEIPYNTWYTIKLTVEPGKFILKSWPKGQAEPADDAAAGVIVFENECFTQERLDSGMNPYFTNRARSYAGVTQVFRLDNLKVTKPYDTMTLPALSGQVGQVLNAVPSFTGQDLMAQQPAPKFRYTVSNTALGRATPGGYLALNGAGTGTVTVELLDMDGKSTGATTSTNLTVTAASAGEQPLRILSIGNGYSRDTLYYLDNLAALVGKNVESAYLSMTDATLRYHAHNVAKNTADYSYYADASGDTAVTSTINDVVEGERWDIIMLQQGVEAAGMNNTFAGDLRYLLDYLADAQPNAKVYWNMNAANQQDTQNRKTNFDDYYNGSQAVMYNAIVGCVDKFIVGADAEYADDFDGWFPVGAAIQNARATAFGDTLTRDGYQLSLQAGRLTAAMTVLKVLFPETDLSAITASEVSSFLDTDKADLGVSFSADPDYTNDDANMALIRQSVEGACANLNKAPAKLATTIATIESSTKDPNDVTVGQTDAPLNLRFADIVVTEDGTVYAGAYESVTHVPARGTLPYTEYCPEGYGRLKIWKSTDNGKTWDFDDPVLVIDQHELDDWGISPGLYDRYERLKSGVQDYAFFNDARDANLGLMYYDMDGNGTEDEVLLFTFFCNDYNESGTSTFQGTFLMHSIDGGATWSIPQRIQSKVLGGGGKRGDIAVFSDGQILFPMYSHPHVSGVLLQWNVNTKQWETIADTEIPNYVPEKTTDFTEPAFIAPDPDGDVVYGFVRDNGQAVISYDRGRSWEHIHTIDGNVQQPGWAYIDENRAFATWSFADGGIRPTKGQMVYFDAGWEATQPVVVHEHYNRTPRDTGDPSSKLLANGKLLTITYDTYFRSIVGKFIDPDAEPFLLPELNDDAAQVTLQTVSGATNLTVNDLPAAHTLAFTAAFNNNSSTLTVTAANGAKVVLKLGEYGIKSAQKDYQVRIAVTNGTTYVKAWREGYAVPDWTAVKGGTSTNSGKAVFTGSGVTLGDVTVTRNATMTMNEGGANTAGMGISSPLQLNPADMVDRVVWDTSDPAVATVDGQGNISFVGTGSVTITATLGDKSVSADYEVGEATGEVTGDGVKKVLFSDDFESYTAGDNAFYKAMLSSGYAAISSAYAKTGYNIVAENGNKHLQLIGSEGKANYPWAIVDTPIFGDYTVQLDFRFDANVGEIFFNMWHGNSIYSMVQIGTDHFNFQYTDAETGDYVNSPIFYSHEPGVWNTIKVARVDGGMYAKVWPKGTPEPANWQYNMLADEMNTDNTVKFRMSFSVQEEESYSARFDNLIISKQRISDVGGKEWIARSDDFEDRTVDQDAFWNDSKYSGFSSSYHKLTEGGILGGLIGGTTYYSRYNIIEESGNKMVELLSTYKVANYFKTTKVTGAYSVSMDLYMPKSTGSSVPGVVINPLTDVSPSLPGNLGIYIDGGDGVRLREDLSTGTAVNTYITDAAGTKMPFKLDTWYTVKVSVTPGKLVVKQWAKGEQEPADNAAAGVLVFESDELTEARLGTGVTTSIMTRNRNEKNVNYIVRVDNLKIAKPYKSLNLPTELTGYAGGTVTLEPRFVGQDLADQTPAPTIRYTSTNTAVASVNAAGVVTYGDVGEAAISVELLDMDGKSHGVAHEVAVTVTAQTEPEQPEEPEEPEKPVEPEEHSTLGTFSLEVVNYITINGEEVAICRWVWTPFY
ncbi:MAG: DUF4886 domain-containing protein [Oscillospiraceae bacterium]|nr:DUF4886 domain-containing protein [Oscillospiraceae bacterium]